MQIYVLLTAQTAVIGAWIECRWDIPANNDDDAIDLDLGDIVETELIHGEQELYWYAENLLRNMDRAENVLNIAFFKV